MIMAQKYPSLARRLELEAKKGTFTAMEYLEESKKTPEDLMIRVARVKAKPENWDDETCPK
jgi:tellurite resistance protein